MLQTEHQYQNEVGDTLSYRVTLPQDPPHGRPHPYCLQMHGFSGCFNSPYIANSAPFIVREGLAAVSFNMTGACADLRKVKTRHLTPYRAINDTLCFLDHLEKKHPELDHTRRAVVAASFGAYTAINVAASFDETPFQHMILKSTVPDLLGPWEGLIGFKLAGCEIVKAAWKKMGVVPQKIVGTWQSIAYDLYDQSKQIDLAKNAARITRPVTLIHGTRDQYASVGAIEELASCMTNAKDVTLRVIDKADHTFEKNKFPHAVAYAIHALRETPTLWDTPSGQNPVMRVA